MSEFEYSSLSSGDSSDEEIIHSSFTKTKKSHTTVKVLKELRLYYSNLFKDSFNLIDLFVKSKKFTYDSFLHYFDAMNFHQIYAKPKGEAKHMLVSPHHYITTTQDALAVASKFLGSRSKEARIGAVFLLYTLYKTQPLKIYQIKIKMKPKDYADTKNLVHEYFNMGLIHPAYCFYDLDIKRNIQITATAVNPCLEANYPRYEIRKHMGRVADKYFQVEYEEREEFEISNKLNLMEQQMRNELIYINKLSNLTVGRDAVPEYQTELLKLLAEISSAKNIDIVEDKTNKNICSKKNRYRNKKNIAFPGVNENVLEDMVTIIEEPDSLDEETIHYNSKNKLKISKKTRNNRNDKKQTNALKEEPTGSATLTQHMDSNSSNFSDDSDDCESIEDKFGDMMWRILEGQDELFQ